MKLLLLGLALALLAGCAAAPMSSQKLAIFQAQMEQQTLQIDCPAGCSVKYRDPRDTVHIPRNTTSWDAVIAVAGSTERLLGAAIVPAAMAYQGIALSRAAIGALADRQDVITTTTTTTSIGDYSGDMSGSVGDYSGDSSGNAGEIITGNSGLISSPTDSTHPPTVVNQPEPVVVVQPEPIIVLQPPSMQ